MKRALFFTFMLYSSILLGQSNTNGNCNCNNGVSKEKLLSVYNQFKMYGLMVKHEESGVDYMIYMIDDLEDNIFMQMCINAWYDIKQQGEEYTYGRFKRRHSEKMDKYDYMNNICYLEILSQLNVKIREHVRSNSYTDSQDVETNALFKEDLLTNEQLSAENYGGFINGGECNSVIEGSIISISDNIDGSSADYFDKEPLLNISIEIRITKIYSSPCKERKVGNDEIFHLTILKHLSDSQISSLKTMLQEGQKIKIKSFYFGYGAEDIFEITN
jgi:hypothetical protein